MSQGAHVAIEDPSVTAPAQQSWESLSGIVRGCVACTSLVAERTNVVPGVRPAGADVILLGEAPGAQEDQTGVPFVGRSGQLLDTLLTEAGLPRERVIVLNVLKCRPPENRKPTRAEVGRCRPWLARQIELARPALIVTLGGTAAEWVVGPNARIGALRGQEMSYAGIRVLVTYHPSAALRFGPRGAPIAALREDLAAAAVIANRARA